MGEAPPEVSPSAPPSADQQAQPNLRLGDEVEVCGLTSETGRLLNTKRGLIERCLPDSGRFEVCVGQRPVGLKPENLQLVGASVRLGPLGLRCRDACEVVGLVSESGRGLNGTVVLVEGWDAPSFRYSVCPASQPTCTKAMRPQNLVPIPDVDLPSVDAAAQVLWALRASFRSPQACWAVRRFLGAAAACLEELDHAAVSSQTSVLSSCGFRADCVGRGQLRMVLASFGSEPAFCRELAKVGETERGEPEAMPFASVIFLDVDGVLHSLHNDEIFRDSCCALLERILRVSHAKVVLSSTWRLEQDKRDLVDAMLRDRGLPPVDDVTKKLSDSPREDEICEWLDRHPEITSWVAIDDMDLQFRTTPSAARLRGHFVRTDQRRGLVPEDAELVLALLYAQRVEARALASASAFADNSVAAAQCWDLLRFDADDGQGMRALTAGEREQLMRLCEACRGVSSEQAAVSPPRRLLEELAAECGVRQPLLQALAQAQLSSVSALAELAAPSPFESRVLRMWYDPGDGGGERSLLEDERICLRRLYEACRAEAGLPAGPYAAAARRAGPRTLREHADALGISALLREALLECLCEFAAA